MACLRRHNITLEDEWRREKNRQREMRERAYAFFKCVYAKAALIKAHSPNGRAATDNGAGKGTVKCAPSLHSRFPFTFLHSANLCWITGGVFNSVFVVLSRSPVQSCDARNCDFVLRAPSDHFAWIDAFIFQYLNILVARIILKYVYMRKCKINCYLIYMTVFWLYR